MGDAADLKEWPLARAIGEVVYWLVWLFFLPLIFAAFGLTALIAPVMSLLSDLLGWIPNLIVAALILIVGWFIARIVQRIATSFFAALGTDKLSDRIGLSKYMGKMTLSALIGMVVFVLIMIPIIVAALEALGLAALTAPLVAMLTAVMVAIPVLIVAVLVIIVAYFVGRVVGDFVATFLAGLGFDNILVQLGLAKEGPEGKRTPSQVVGWLVMIGIILAAALSAFTMLHLDPLAQLLSGFIVLVGADHHRPADLRGGPVARHLGLQLRDRIRLAAQVSAGAGGAHRHHRAGAVHGADADGAGRFDHDAGLWRAADRRGAGHWPGLWPGRARNRRQAVGAVAGFHEGSRSEAGRASARDTGSAGDACGS